MNIVNGIKSKIIIWLFGTKKKHKNIDLKNVETKEQKSIYEEINIWTWVSTSVLEIINMTNEVTWGNLPYKIADRRAWDVDIVYCNADKAEEMLGWKAKLSVQEAIEDQYKFIINEANKNK